MNELSVNEAVQIRIVAGDDFATPGSDSRALYSAVVNERRTGKLVLSAASRPDEFAVNATAGTKIIVSKWDGPDFIMYKAVITALLTQVPPAIVARILTEGEKAPRRSFLRVPMDNLEVRYARADLPGWAAASLQDLSEGGACLAVTHQLALGEPLRLEVRVAQQMFYLKAAVRRCSAVKASSLFVLGVEFLDNADSQKARLRSIVSKRVDEIGDLGQYVPIAAAATAGR